MVIVYYVFFGLFLLIRLIAKAIYSKCKENKSENKEYSVNNISISNKGINIPTNNNN